MTDLSQLKLITVAESQLSADTRERVIALCSCAFESDYRPIMDTFEAATHILGFVDDHLATHALWVTRWLQVGQGSPLRTAYVEGVATDLEHRRRGFAQAVMEEVIVQIQDYELAGLSPFSTDYYGRLGWELWKGPLYVRVEQSFERSPADEQVMVYKLPKSPELDLTASLSAEWRKGEPW